jgi:hypothetical protein
MYTYTMLGSLAAKLCNKVGDSTVLTLLQQFNNDSIRVICNLQGGKLRFLESTANMSTVASQEAYQIPNKYRKLIDMYVYSGSGSSSDVIYSPEMIFDPVRWKLVLQYRLGESDVPYFTYVENTSFRIQPIPSTTGNLIVLRGRLQVRDLSIADVTNITVASITNGATAMVVSGSLTQDFVGRYIQITETSAAGGGDGFWYEIAAVTDATHLTLTKPYEGTTITAGTAASTIGQVPVVPQAYQLAVVYRTVALYWQQQQNAGMAKTYWYMYDGGKEAGYSKEYGGLILEMLENEGETEEGAYIPPFGTTNNVMQAPYYYAFQDASGF